MKKSAFAFALAFLLTAAPAVAETATCTDVSKQDVEALFDRWNSSLQTGDAHKVTLNYAEDAVLLPTVSNKPRTDHNAIMDYFEHFLQKKPKGKIDTRNVHIGCNEAFDVGTYTFALTGPDGKVTNVAARYTFIYGYDNGKWLIKHHHSSAMPEKADAKDHGKETAKH